MADKAISQLPSASALQDADLLLISQRQTGGSYITGKVTADKLKGKSAYEEWVSLNTSINAF